MRIHEWNKNAGAADAKGIGNGLEKANEKKLYEAAAGGCKAKGEADSFLSSLQRSMVQEGAVKEYREKERANLNHKPVSRIEREMGGNRAESVNIRMEANAAAGRRREVPARGIPYSECDKVEIHVPDGYVLKAKRDETAEGDCRVYVEKKSDDGEIRAYLFEGSCFRQEGGDEMERMAYAVIHAAGEGKGALQVSCAAAEGERDKWQ